MDDKKYDSRYDGETTDKILDNAKAIMEQTTAEDGETVQVYDTNGVPHKIAKTELLKKSTLALPKLDDISSFVAINEAGNAVGLMTKEQVASVLAELMGVGFLEKGNYHDINEVGTYTTYSNTPQAGPFFSIQCGDSCIQESMSYGGYSLMVRSYNHVDGKWNEWKSIAI
ncbi:hypothetical protein [Phocaeicola plebeius]|uniref:hypothetical protein n=1 Tax=Phocaeicola plebeius TaxID=310297 RepID=UPI00402A49FE